MLNVRNQHKVVHISTSDFFPERYDFCMLISIINKYANPI